MFPDELDFVGWQPALLVYAQKGACEEVKTGARGSAAAGPSSRAPTGAAPSPGRAPCLVSSKKNKVRAGDLGLSTGK